LRERDRLREELDKIKEPGFPTAEKYHQLKSDLARLREELELIGDILSPILYDVTLQQKGIAKAIDIIATEVPVCQPPDSPASEESLTGPTYDELGDPKEQPCCTELEKKAPVTDSATPTPGAEATTTPANLAPCPACGCKDIRVMFCFSDAGFAGRDGKHFMQCGNKKCGMCGPIRHGLDGVMLARAAWNGLCNKVNPLCFGHALSETPRQAGAGVDGY
jgi:hypothetical protein